MGQVIVCMRVFFKPPSHNSREYWAQRFEPPPSQCMVRRIADVLRKNRQRLEKKTPRIETGALCCVAPGVRQTWVDSAPRQHRMVRNIAFAAPGA